MKKFIPLLGVLFLSACFQPKLDTSSAENFATTAEKVIEEVDGSAAEKREVRRVLTELSVAMGMAEMGGIFGMGASSNPKLEQALNELDGKTADDLVKLIQNHKK